MDGKMVVTNSGSPMNQEFDCYDGHVFLKLLPPYGCMVQYATGIPLPVDTQLPQSCKLGEEPCTGNLFVEWFTLFAGLASLMPVL
jgi:hypothetical protein